MMLLNLALLASYAYASVPDVFAELSGYPGCIRLLTIENQVKNKVLCELEFAFVSGTFVPIIGSVFTEVVNTNVLSIGEDARIESPQGVVYIQFDTSNSTPAFDPTLTYALRITARARPTFSELVRIYSIFVTQLTPAPTGLLSVSSTFSFYLIWPAAFDFSNQMVIIAFNSIAESNHVALSTIPGPPAFAATITTDALSFDTGVFSGTMVLPLAGLQTDFAFTNYTGVPSRIISNLISLAKEIEIQSFPPCMASHEFLGMCRITSLTGIIKELCSRCRKPRCPPKHQNNTKFCLLKYFAFVTCCLRCLPEMECNEQFCSVIKEVCCSAEDCISSFVACASQLIPYCTKSELAVCVSAMFDVVVGYNPFCSNSGYCCELYGLSEKDACMVSKACCNFVGQQTEVMVKVDIEGFCEQESSSECEPAVAGAGRHHKRSFASKYKWHITVTVIVVLAGCASAYALMM